MRGISCGRNRLVFLLLLSLVLFIQVCSLQLPTRPQFTNSHSLSRNSQFLSKSIQQASSSTFSNSWSCRYSKRKFSPLRKFHLAMSQQTSPEIKQKVDEGDLKGALQVLQRNPMLSLSLDDGAALLNYIEDEAVSTNFASDDASGKQIIGDCTFLYRRMERQQILRGFGCIDGEYPEKSVEVSPQRLEEITGIPMSSLTPKRRTTYWQLAGISVCVAEYFIGREIGIGALPFKHFVNHDVFPPPSLSYRITLKYIYIHTYSHKKYIIIYIYIYIPIHIHIHIPIHIYIHI